MTHTFTRKQGKLYRYYTPSAVRRGLRERCSVGTVSAPSIEETVMAQIRAIIRQPEVILGVWQQVESLGLVTSEEDIRRRLLALDGVWGELFPAEQRQFIGLLVKQVVMTPHGASIHLHASGLEQLLQQLIETDRRDTHGGYHCSDGTSEGEESQWQGSRAGPARLEFSAG
jgi:hypothetical protein